MTVTGKTVELAVEEALSRLAVSRDQVTITVLEEPKKGFLGWIGARDASVEVTLLPTPLEEVEGFLREVLDAMGLPTVQLVVKQQSDYVLVNFVGDELGILIGRRGQTLDALQYLTSIVANKAPGTYIRFILDAEGYRKRREESLLRLADQVAQKVLRLKKSITLEPMNPMERKVVHTRIQEQKELTTKSEGEEPFRKVVVSWKKTM
ncbi:RNA-binding cell elongation regulator Jag/EloR [Marininema halotolerans]|uniref:RNA-binding cell elongation regulator Jag/EloR n=1 Tax=Marininema halotolerans TaxID=1155944 RepID=UPI001FE557F4|nr:RNA-binding cell elongation regulator Jag/EloR [Marininema halotolerans]